MIDTEIMIGDYFTINGSRIGRINSIDARNKRKTCTLSNTDDLYGEISISPVQLITEMLEYNGIIYKKNKCSYYIDRLYISHSLDVTIYNKVIHVEFVHQLQHILRMCGMGYLADNFKVYQS